MQIIGKYVSILAITLMLFLCYTFGTVSTYTIDNNLDAKDDPSYFTGHNIHTDTEGTDSVFVADLDGDNDQDIIVGNSNRKNRWYENDGGSPPSFTGHDVNTDVDDTGPVFVADLDGDTDLDIIVGNEFTNKWYENDGNSPPSFTGHDIHTDIDRTVSVFVADLDGDTDLDIVVGNVGEENVGGTNKWYENDGGSPPSFTGHDIHTDADWTLSVFVADLDGDNDLDILAGDCDDVTKNKWYENDGGSPPSFIGHDVHTDADWTLSVFVADLDGDTDLDIIVGNEFTNKWYENDGNSPPSFTGHDIHTDAVCSVSIFVADLDGDNDQDIIAGNHNKTNKWYENDGNSPPSFTGHDIHTDSDWTISIFVADLDGDNYLDVISGNCDRDTENKWYENYKKNNPPDKPATPEGPISGIEEVSYEFNFSAIDPDGDNVSYFVDWGDGNSSGWLGPYNSSDICRASHVFDDPGIYIVRVKAKDVYDNEGVWSDNLTVEMVEKNSPPDMPDMPLGPESGKIGVEYGYDFETIDPDGDNVSYFVDWGDGNMSGWTSFYCSGDWITLNYSWSNIGQYSVRVKAKDVYDNESVWSESLLVDIVEENITVNEPPVVDDISDQIVFEGEDFTMISLGDYVFDPDNSDSEIEWVITGNSSLSVEIKGTGGGSPPRNDKYACIYYPDGWIGSEVLNFTAVDPGGLLDWDSVTFTVKKDDLPPPVLANLSLSVDKGVFNSRLFIGRVNVLIENIGEVVAHDVNWSISIVGGMLGGANVSKEGKIDSLEVDDGEVVSSWSLESRIVRKVGSIDIKLEATVDGITFSKDVVGFVIGRIVKVF